MERTDVRCYRDRFGRKFFRARHGRRMSQAKALCRFFSTQDFLDISCTQSSMKNSFVLFAATMLVLCGCTSINVRPVSASEKITSVVIRTNPRVTVSDFLDSLDDGFERHGIKATIVPEDADVKDAYVVTYTSGRRWDMAPYLTQATIAIDDKNGRRIAYAEYHLRNGGGLSPMKWESTRTKIDPVIDELLQGVQKNN
ncbi:MAG TPA: Sbal_3080 family lipoprotein [Verrucomicrobiae bacterium]